MTPISPISMPQIPACAWSRSIGQGWENPYVVRYPSNLDDGPWHGAPIGGFGAGCIGRGHHGQFNLWHIDGGEHTFENFAGCQFAIFEQTGDRTQAYALATQPPDDGSLETWNWYPAENSGTYSALYPRSWFEYRNVFKAEITCEQYSPIIADNYQETSYPVGCFVWTIHNPTDEPIEISILMSWENLAGWFLNTAKSPEIQVRDDGSPFYDYVPRIKQSKGNLNQLIGDESRIGIVMDNARLSADDPAEGDGEWSIATLLNPLNETTYHTRWNPDGDGSDLWESFAATGLLPNIDDNQPAGTEERIGGAIAVKFRENPSDSVCLSLGFPHYGVCPRCALFQTLYGLLWTIGDSKLDDRQARFKKL